MAKLYYQRVKHPSKCPCGSGLPCVSAGIYVHGKYRKHGNVCPECIGSYKLRTVLTAIESRPGCTTYPELEARW